MSDLGWLYKQKGMQAIHGIGALVALIAPTDVLYQFIWIKNSTHALSSILPLIDNFSRESSFPEVVKLQAGLSILFSPYCAYLWTKWPGREKNKAEILSRARAGLLNAIALHGLTILLFISAIVYLFLVNGSDFFIAPFKSSRLALALFGPVFFTLVPAGFLVTLSSLISVIKKYWGIN